MINCKKALTEGYLVSALVLVAVLMRRSGGVAGMSTPVSDDDVCHSVRCAYHAVENKLSLQFVRPTPLFHLPPTTADAESNDNFFSPSKEKSFFISTGL